MNNNSSVDQTTALESSEYMTISNEKSSEKEALINHDTDKEEHGVYWYRWYILFQFALLSFIQTHVAGSWSPINVSAKQALNFTNRDFVLLSNWGVAGLLVFLPLDMWLIVKHGMRIAVFSGAVCVLLGTGLSCLPLGMYKKYAIHVGQALNGIGGCPVLGAAPYISNTWFPLRERIFATGFMLLSGNLGGVMSYLLGPYLVEEPSNVTQANVTDNTARIRHEIEIYLLIQFGIAVALFVMMLTFFPNKPPLPPSQSAATKRLDFKAGLTTLSKNLTYWSVVAVFCGTVASFYAWSGVMPLLYTKRGISQITIGQMGAIMSGAGVLVGIGFCWFADRVKTYVSVLWVISIYLAYVMCLYVVAIAMNWISVIPFTFTPVGWWVSCLSLGVLVYSIQPLGLEIASDVAYPVNEGTSNYVLMWLGMLLNVIFFSSLSGVQNQDVAFYMMLGMMSIAPPLLYFSIPKTNRRLLVDLSASPLLDD